MKKIINSIFISLLLIASFSVNFLCESTDDSKIYTEGFLQYTIKNNEITIVYYYGNDSSVTIPWNIGEKEIVKIATGAFSDSSLTSARVPENVVIEKDAFKSTTTISRYNAYGESIKDDTDKKETPEEKVDDEPVVDVDDKEKEQEKDNTKEEVNDSKDVNVETNNVIYENNDVVFEEESIDIGVEIEENNKETNVNKTTNNTSIITEVVENVTNVFENIKTGEISDIASEVSPRTFGVIIIVVCIILIVFVVYKFILSD